MTPKLLRILPLLLLTILFQVHFSYAQKYHYKEYGINDGLPSSQVYDVYQDKDNILWFATDRGIASFNGYEFKTYDTNKELPGTVVLAFYPQSNGEVWCATFNNKLFYFKEHFDGFYEFSYNDVIDKVIEAQKEKIEYVYKDQKDNIHLAITHDKIDYITIDKEGKSVVNTSSLSNSEPPNIGNYYFIMENSQGAPFCYFNDEKKLPFKAEVTYDVLAKGNYLIKTTRLHQKEVTVFINKMDVDLVNKHNELYKTINNGFRPLCAIPIDDDHFLVGYYINGAAVINTKGEVVETFLDKKSVTDFLIDHEGGYWLTTLNDGVFYIKNPKLKQLVIPGYEAIGVNPLKSNHKNELFVGYYNGDIFKIDNNKEATLIYKTKRHVKPRMSYDRVRQRIMFYSGEGVFSYADNELTHQLFGYTHKISEKHLPYTIYSDPHGLKISDDNIIKQKIIIKERVYDAAYKDETILIGTSKGLLLYENDTLVNKFEESPLYRYRIEDIDVNDLRDEFYLGTLGKGVVVTTRDTIYNIDRESGIFSNNIKELHIQSENELLVASDGGVNRIIFDKDGTYSITGLNSKRGLISDEVRDMAVIQDTLWIGTKKGLMYTPVSAMEPSQLINDITTNIKGIKVNDKQRDTAAIKRLAYDENNIVFSVQALSYQYQNQLRYDYTIDGLHDKWYSSSERTIRFSALPPGRYTFKVKACVGTDECSEKITTYSFIICDPYWDTWWFSTIIALIVALIIYVFFRVRILTYNKDVIRELIRLVIKRFTKEETYLLFREAGKDVRILTNTIGYVKSSGNYIDIFTDQGRHTVRNKIGEFISLTPDPLEYVRIHRFYIVRIDHIQSKSNQEVILKNDTKLPVGKTYVEQLDKIQFH